MIVSGILDTLDKNKTYVVYTDENKQGQILYWIDNTPQTISFQDASSEAKEKAEAIIINEADLILPPESIYSVSEKDQRSRNIRKQRIFPSLPHPRSRRYYLFRQSNLRKLSVRDY